VNTFKPFVVTTTHKIFHIANTGKSGMAVKEVSFDVIADLHVVPTGQRNMLEIIKDFSKNLLEKAGNMLKKAKDLLVSEAKSGNITATKLAAAGAAGFVVGFLFGAAETTLRQHTPLFAGLLSDWL
jgi:archaellum component FlaG (FlaF/FlaG flagellin family)